MTEAPKKLAWRPVLCFLLVLSLVCYGPGCANFRPAPYVVTPQEKAQLPTDVAFWVTKLDAEGERNAVLNLTELANRAIADRDAIASELLVKVVDHPLDEAIRRIEAIYSNTPEARKARSLWHEESSKDFKGEPYERTFVFLLRGLRYYEAGDFENARACFTSGILQGSLSIEGEFPTEMATFEYLVALCNAKLNDNQAAQEAIGRARECRPGLPFPQKDSNLLVVGLVGAGPVKERAGDYQEILLITDGMTTTADLAVCVPWFGAPPVFLDATETDDMGFLARTRGGRAVDLINKRKASAKSAVERTAKVTALAGTSFLSAGAVMAMMKSMNSGGDSKAAMVVLAIGGCLLVISVGVMLVSMAIKTKADIRAIHAVPGHIYLWEGRTLPGNQRIIVQSCRGGFDTPETSYFNLNIPDGSNHEIVYLRLP